MSWKKFSLNFDCSFICCLTLLTAKVNIATSTKTEASNKRSHCIPPLHSEIWNSTMTTVRMNIITTLDCAHIDHQLKQMFFFLMMLEMILDKGKKIKFEVNNIFL